MSDEAGNTLADCRFAIRGLTELVGQLSGQVGRLVDMNTMQIKLNDTLIARIDALEKRPKFDEKALDDILNFRAQRKKEGYRK